MEVANAIDGTSRGGRGRGIPQRARGPTEACSPSRENDGRKRKRAA
jgi:hypothetical protein